MPSNETEKVAVEATAHTSPPCIMVIFGAAGDLTKRKLIPALYKLKKGNLLSDSFAVIGVARAVMDDGAFRRRSTAGMSEFAAEDIEPAVWQWLEERLYYLSGDFDDDQTFASLKEMTTRIDSQRKTQGNYFFYLATAPEYFAKVTERLGSIGLN